MSSTPFIRPAPTSFRLVLPTGILSNTTSESVGRLGLSPTATGNATGPAQAPLLAGVGGAGLILVFVACALLLLVLIATFIIRGLRGPRARLESGGAPWDDFESPVARPPSPRLGEKPGMTDVYITASSTQQYATRNAGSWRNVQPLSASRVIDTVTLPTLPKGKRASISSIDSAYSQDDDDSLSSIDLSPPPRYAMDMGSRSPHVPLALRPTSPKPSNVRVAVPIAMPRPPPSVHNPWNATSPHDVDLGRTTDSYFEHGHHPDGAEDVPEFCLGIAEVSPGRGKQQKADKEKKE